MVLYLFQIQFHSYWGGVDLDTLGLLVVPHSDNEPAPKFPNFVLVVWQPQRFEWLIQIGDKWPLLLKHLLLRKTSFHVYACAIPSSLAACSTAAATAGATRTSNTDGTI